MKRNEKALTTKQVAELTGYSVNTIYMMVCKREIPFYKRAGAKNASLRFYASEIKKWLNAERYKVRDTEADEIMQEINARKGNF